MEQQTVSLKLCISKITHRQIAKAKQYLDDTEHKFNMDYEPKVDEDLELIKTKRSEARAFVRANK